MIFVCTNYVMEPAFRERSPDVPAP